MSDGETGPNIVQGKNRRPSLSKRLASKRLNAATAAVAAASSGQQTPSPSGAGLGGEKSASLPSSPVPPVVQDLSSIKEDLVNGKKFFFLFVTYFYLFLLLLFFFYQL